MINIFLSTLLFFSFCFSKSNIQKKQNNQQDSAYKVIKCLATQSQTAEILQRIKSKNSWSKSELFDIGGLSEDTPCYIVDINNDKKLEYVFITYQGSGGYLYPFIFVEDVSEIKMVQPPKSFKLDAIFENPFTDEEELFIELNNNIFVFGRDRYDWSTRKIMFWKNDKCIEMVNDFWIQQQRTLFNNLFKVGRYNDAFKLLDTFESSSRKFIDPQVNLWIRNDISLAALRDGSPFTSLNIINSIKKEKAFSKASANLTKSVAFNEKLAKKAIEHNNLHGTKGEYDYSWLLEYTKDKSPGNLISDPRFHTLLASMVPDISSPDSLYKSWSWRDQIRFHLFGGHPIVVKDARYITFSGFWPHQAMCRGFLWCDIQDKVSAIATGVSGSSPNILYITSRSFFEDAIPVKFIEALRSWCKEQDINSSQVLFYDRLGRQFDVKIKPIEADLKK